jgi:hypothetical protein
MDGTGNPSGEKRAREPLSTIKESDNPKSVGMPLAAGCRHQVWNGEETDLRNKQDRLA